MPWADVQWLVPWLIAAALSTLPVFFLCDHALARFRRKPHSTHVALATLYIFVMKCADVVFYGGFAISAILVLSMFDHGDHNWFVETVFSVVYLAALGIACFAAYVIRDKLRRFLGASREPLPREALPPYGAGRLDYFAAGKFFAPGKKQNKDDRDPDAFMTFKVFIAPAMLCGARVADKLDSAATTLSADPANDVPWLDGMFYDAFDVTAPQFRALNDENFRILWRDVASIACDPAPKPKKIIKSVNSGSIAITLTSGDVGELFILGTRDTRALADRLQSLKDGAT